MDLEDDPALEPLGLQPVVATEHRDLHDVRGGSLDDRVDRQPLAQLSRLALARPKLGDRSTPAQQGRDVARCGGPLDHPLTEPPDRREAFQVGRDEFLALGPGNVEPVGQPEPGKAIDDPEVDHLRAGALGVVDLVRLDVEDLGGRCAMDVKALAEEALQHLVLSHLRQDPELDLAVVGRNHQVSLAGHEATPDRASQLGPDGNVLQVGVGAGQTAGRRGGLVKGRVDPTGCGIDQVRQGVEISALQLAELPPALDQRDDLVLFTDLGEHPGVGRVAGLALPLPGQAELLEEHLADLLGRADRELVAGQLMDLLLDSAKLRCDLRPDGSEPVDVELEADPLHRVEHLDQGKLDVPEEVLEPHVLQLPALGAGEVPDRKHPPGCVFGRSLLSGLEAELTLGRSRRRRAGSRYQVVELVAAAVRLDQPGGQLRVVNEPEAVPSPPFVSTIRTAEHGLGVVSHDLPALEVPGPVPDRAVPDHGPFAVRGDPAAVGHQGQLARLEVGDLPATDLGGRPLVARLLPPGRLIRRDHSVAQRLLQPFEGGLQFERPHEGPQAGAVDLVVEDPVEV